MEPISVPEGVGLAGVLAILFRNHWPAIKTLLTSLLGEVVPSLASDPTITDVGCVMAYGTIRPRLTEDTAATVWAEIQPAFEAEPSTRPGPSPAGERPQSRRAKR